MPSDLEKQIDAARRDVIRCERYVSKSQDELRWAEQELRTAKGKLTRLSNKAKRAEFARTGHAEGPDHV